MLTLLVLLCGVAILTLSRPPASVARGQGDTPARRYITGTVVGVGGRFGGRTRPFTLIVNRHTPPAEVQQLNAALQSGGQDELLRVLSRMDAGRVQIGTGVGVTANAIIATPQDGGTKLTVLYQRNINFFESRYGTRSEDYKFGYAEIYLRPRGNSEGTLIPAAKVRLRDGNTWEVEDFGVFPARLLGLQVRR
ncbi:MAG: hypothetical protein M3430_04405 [Acidobacteriota bacterium]|nr:hypothetical protein [Acidobacteriota bacterium]